VHSVRVLLSALPAVVRDAVSDAAVRQAGLEVVGVADPPSLLLEAAGALRADVVVVATVDGELPGIASHLLDQYPDIRVVGVSADGRRALVHRLSPHTLEVAGATPAELAEAIRATCPAQS